MSKIEWTNETLNPVIGCTKCSPGCENCYAEKMAGRLWHIEKEDGGWYKDLGCYDGKWSGKIITIPEVLDKPLHWRRPRRIFVCSMSDLFHPKVPFEFIDKVFETIFYADWHIYQILTKRIQRALEYFNHLDRWLLANTDSLTWTDKPSNHVHLGVSICTQKEADEKIPILLQIPAAMRFVSLEPMLEGIDISRLFDNYYLENTLGHMTFIDWIIVGAESKGHFPGRECKLEWVQSIVDQCRAANVPCFVKQIHKDGKLVKMPKEFTQEYPNGK